MLKNIYIKKLFSGLNKFSEKKVGQKVGQLWGKKWGKTVYLINFEIKVIKYDYKKNYKIFNT